MLMQAGEALSANEAATVTGVPLRQVHRIVDAGLLEGAVETREGTRVILGKGLVGLKFAYETAGLLSPGGRRRLLGRVLAQPSASSVTENAVKVDLRPMEAAIRDGLDRLAKAREMVRSDARVMNGMPCVAGTRIPVHDIAAMLAGGDDPAAILAAYPRLTEELVDFAATYAAAYPRRGRPPRRPAWRKGAALSVEKGHLDDLMKGS